MAAASWSGWRWSRPRRPPTSAGCSRSWPPVPTWRPPLSLSAQAPAAWPGPSPGRCAALSQPSTPARRTSASSSTPRRHWPLSDLFRRRVMYLKRWFRMLEYATLGLACWCLLFALAPFARHIDRGVPVVWAVLLLAWWVEGRWLLPAWAANVLALAAVAAVGVWCTVLFMDEDSWLQHAPMPAGFVPTLGPVLIVLLLIKLFRPRAPSDFWLLQGMGLLLVS